MENSLILVAAGRGQRAGGGLPKQYQALGNLPVITRTLRAVLAHQAVGEVIPVIHSDDVALYDSAVKNITDPRLRPPVFGGDTRTESVYNGLQAARGKYVLIHDAARPFVPADMLTRVMEATAKTGAAFAALPISDALWRVENNKATQAIPRADMWRAQTPQGFGREAMLNAYKTLNLNFANTDDMPDDDVGLMARAGVFATPVMGAVANIKLTHPSDFERAEAMMNKTTRIGTGFDVHRFGAGDYVILCGVRIPHSASLVGHSDADVGLHAITDALLGALGQGDIGRWFPPDDAQWRGAESSVFLAHAVGLCAAAGLQIGNIDCTLICEAPKITPYAESMVARVAEICAIDAGRVNIKATTSEGLGFTGRGEGIAAQASVCLQGDMQGGDAA